MRAECFFRVTLTDSLTFPLYVKHMRRASIASLILLNLAACGPGSSPAAPEWPNVTVYAKVGEVSYELEPGPTYSLQSLSDEEINSAIAAGWGTSNNPLDVSNIRIGVHTADRARIEYDISIVDSTDHLGARKAVDLPIDLSELTSVGFEIDMSNLYDKTLENAVILKFKNGKSKNVPVTCRAQHLQGAQPVLTCSDLLLIYDENFVVINSRSGDFEAVLRDFSNGLAVVSKIKLR